MHRKIVSGLVLITLLISILTVTFNIKIIRADPTTWIVDDDGPADFDTVQEAVNHANDGDTIFIRNGTYYEHTFVDKSLTFIGENKSTIVFGNGTGSAFFVLSSEEAPRIKVTGFTIRNYDSGIRSRGDGHGGSSSFEAIDNFFIGNHIGACIDEYGSGSVVDNVFFNNTNGIYAGYRTWTNITGNRIFLSNGYAIEFYFEPYGSATNNYIQDSQYGIFLSGNEMSTFAYTFRNNTLLDNDYAVYIGISPAPLPTMDLQFHFNNFINNTQQVTFMSEVMGFSWDAGYLLGGNYWSDYTGTDLYGGPYQNMTGSDGFGDNPYVIDDSNQDNYPFMEPFVFPKDDVLLPIIERVSGTPLIPNYDVEVEIEAVVLDDVEVDLVLLFYSYEGSTYNVTMSRNGDVFTAIIPALPYNTYVQYRVYAKDVNENWAVSDIYSYTVIDNTPPEIHFVQCTSLLKIQADVTEPPDASGTDRVLLHFKVDDGDWWNTTLAYDNSLELWTTTIFGYNQLADKTIEYFIEAYDMAGNRNPSETLTYSVEEWRVGDLNRDGNVHLVDLLIVVRYFRWHTRAPALGTSMIVFVALLIGPLAYEKHRKKKTKPKKRVSEVTP